ncbi:hypothetical protein FQN57_004485 [Myotisia sp. PD_48]|nr:hypothetical protein FQN57_004485 [Myotisia sp. PD_48]
MAGGALTSHHVNYLIWRYLQESGHGEAAVMLQRAWNPDPQNLPFAPSIRTNALISLVQKGLQYHELEQSIDLTGNVLSGQPPPFFGQLDTQPNISQQATENNLVHETTSRETQPTISSPKDTASQTGSPPSLTNGNLTSELNQATIESTNAAILEKESETPANSAREPMVIETHEETPVQPAPTPTDHVLDADGDVGMTSPLPPEPPSPTFTLTTGQSIGIQITPPKAVDLTPETTLVNVPSDSHVINTAWRPGDPFLFSASTETFCGLWKLSGQRSPTTPTHETLVEGSNVTAMDWEPDGSILAVATYSNFVGTVTMYDSHGAVIDVLPSMPGLVSGLRWSKKGRRIVLIVSDGKQSKLLLWNEDMPPDSYPTAPTFDGAIYEVVWSRDEELYACGDGCIYRCRVLQGIDISETFSWEESFHDPWTIIRASSWAGSPIVAAASSSTANLWIPSHDIKIESAHHADITSLELRPQCKPYEESKDSQLILATSSMDETVKLWSIDVVAKRVTCMHRLFLGPSLPALSAVFSPDGYAIAAASHDKLFIWNVERGGSPLGTWSIPSDQVKGELEHNGTASSDTSDVSILDRPLSWDSDGKKIAFGIGKKIAIVNLQR